MTLQEKFVCKIILDSCEFSYIIQQFSRCSSAVGRRGASQRLSLAAGCMRAGIIQHEFLHALGFYHEQSRPDRGDFVRILLDNVQAGKAHNFRQENSINSLSVAYDPNSLMHYGK